MRVGTRRTAEESSMNSIEFTNQQYPNYADEFLCCLAHLKNIKRKEGKTYWSANTQQYVRQQSHWFQMKYVTRTLDLFIYRKSIERKIFLLCFVWHFSIVVFEVKSIVAKTLETLAKKIETKLWHVLPESKRFPRIEVLIVF